MKKFKDLPPKKCMLDGCEKMIERKRRKEGRWESPDRHERQKFCSPACANQSKRRADGLQLKTCVQCGKTFSRNIKTKERLTRFLKRTWCSKKCYYAFVS